MQAERMSLSIDHVTIAGARLEPLQQAFTGLGLSPTYGGAHSNGVTHMALLSFVDGSYIELISTVQPGQPSPWWHGHIAGDGGPCAWASRCDDVAAEAARLADLGIAVRGPFVMHRERPDGTQLEWELAYPGKGEPGSTLPFLIQDRTPRVWRVPPEAAVAAGVLTGLASVVLGVPDLAAVTDLFRRAYGWARPERVDDPAFGAHLAHFRGTPVTLAAPLSGDGWLAERLARFGPSPCAFLLGSSDFKAACARFGLTLPGKWFGRRVGWLDRAGPRGTCLGIL
jgi:hypothetical protein